MKIQSVLNYFYNLQYVAGRRLTNKILNLVACFIQLILDSVKVNQMGKPLLRIIVKLILKEILNNYRILRFSYFFEGF